MHQTAQQNNYKNFDICSDMYVSQWCRVFLFTVSVIRPVNNWRIVKTTYEEQFGQRSSDLNGKSTMRIELHTNYR